MKASIDYLAPRPPAAATDETCWAAEVEMALIEDV
jgi:hypothetical protein